MGKMVYGQLALVNTCNFNFKIEISACDAMAEPIIIILVYYLTMRHANGCLYFWTGIMCNFFYSFAFSIDVYRFMHEHWNDIQSSVKAVFWSLDWSGCIWEGMRLLENTELFSSPYYSASDESVRACWVRLAFPSPPFILSFFSLRYNRKVFVTPNLMPAHIKQCQAAPISVPTTWLRRNECFFYPRLNMLHSKLHDCFQLQLVFSLSLSFWGFAVRMNFPKVI